jgi:hypothetical protein
LWFSVVASKNSTFDIQVRAYSYRLSLPWWIGVVVLNLFSSRSLYQITLTHVLLILHFFVLQTKEKGNEQYLKMAIVEEEWTPLEYAINGAKVSQSFAAFGKNHAIQKKDLCRDVNGPILSFGFVWFPHLFSLSRYLSLLVSIDRFYLPFLPY